MREFNESEINKPEVLEALRAIEKRGRLTPEAVFAAAKSSASPLHDFFEWNRDRAFKNWNLQVARKLIGSVQYIRHVEDHGFVQRVTLPAYVRDPEREPAQQGYVALRAIAPRSSTAKSVVLAECEAASGHLRRAATIAIALGFNREIERIISELEEFTARVKESEPTMQAAE